MAKRSPILGYNHNVRYRGLVFHVQTEDSGVLSPHLFTHLFHGGVIVSTRKLVYDAGANEEAIKALMQAQHKAVMKDLKKGSFDDKIDQYLAGTPGLEARGGAATATPDPERAATAPDPATPARTPSSDSVPVEPHVVFKKPRTATSDRPSASAMPPPPDALPEDAPTLTGSMAQDMAQSIRAKSAGTQPVVIAPRAATPVPGSPVIGRAATPAARVVPNDYSIDSSPEIQILGDDDSGRVRPTRDTEVSVDVTVPNAVPEVMRRADSASLTRKSPTGDRPASHVGATLPPARPPQRPSFTPPQVIARPQTQPGRDTEPIELYPTTEQPAADRPGQYSVKKGSSENTPLREQPGRVPPARNPGAAPPRPQAAPPPRQVTQTQARGIQQTPAAGAGVVPPKVPGRPASGNQPPIRQPPSNVVMTRPAVVVGAPPKPANPPRVRKAREDEGRGFGSGLISEKSLDEVILAYLSEDAEDK